MPTRSANITVNVAEAKRRFADLLGRVAYGGEAVLITRRGRAMARLVPVKGEEQEHPSSVRGWLEDDDPYFRILEGIVRDRARHRPRAFGRRRARRRRA